MFKNLLRKLKWLALSFIIYKIHIYSIAEIVNWDFYQDHYPWTLPLYFLPTATILFLFLFYRNSIRVTDNVKGHFEEKGYSVVSERPLTLGESLNYMHFEIAGLSNYTDRIKRVLRVQSEELGLYEIVALVTMEKNKAVTVEYLSRERVD